MVKNMEALTVKDYIQKINMVESMLEEIKQGLSHLDDKFQESIKKGERDIKEGRVTVCKTSKDLDKFFASI